MSLTSINPATGDILKTYAPTSLAHAHQKIIDAHLASLAWRELSFAHRADRFQRVIQLLEDHKEEYAQLMATEMGKPLAQGRAEIEKCIWGCTYYAEAAETLLAPQWVETDALKSYVAYQPLGVILGIMPWNFPFWQVFRFVAPTLMAGNAIVLKHASNVSGCSLAIEALMTAAGFPDGLFSALLLPPSDVLTLIEDPLVRAVTLTGSTSAGKAVAAKAGAYLKKTVMELGGSDPYLILEDADLEHAAATCVSSRLLNGGQSCIAAKRWIVSEKVLADFETLVVEEMCQRVVGDPLTDGVDIGPLARLDLRDALHQQVTESIAKGAKCLLGGTVPSRKGAFYLPTILTNVTATMPAYSDELFGPVAAIIPVTDDQMAIEVANDTVFGLGSAVFSQDLERAEAIARDRIDAGNCFVNTLVRSDPRLPFGGVKGSGYGRELSSFGIHEFVNIKTVYIK